MLSFLKTNYLKINCKQVMIIIRGHDGLCPRSPHLAALRRFERKREEQDEVNKAGKTGGNLRFPPNKKSPKALSLSFFFKLRSFADAVAQEVKF